MVMMAAVRGNFIPCVTFLVGLGDFAYVEQIDEIQIQQNPDGLELRVKFWWCVRNHVRV